MYRADGPENLKWLARRFLQALRPRVQAAIVGLGLQRIGIRNLRAGERVTALSNPNGCQSITVRSIRHRAA